MEHANGGFDPRELSIGLEQQSGDDAGWIQRWLESVGRTALDRWYYDHPRDGERRAVEYVETQIQGRYPDRAYFIETEEDGKGVQVYQPWGMPRVDQ